MPFALYHISRLSFPLLAFHSIVQVQIEFGSIGISVTSEGLKGVVGEFLMPTTTYYLKVITFEEYETIGTHYTIRAPLLERVKHNQDPLWNKLPDIKNTQECRNCFTVFPHPCIYTVCSNCLEACKRFRTTPYKLKGNRRPPKPIQTR